MGLNKDLYEFLEMVAKNYFYRPSFSVFFNVWCQDSDCVLLFKKSDRIPDVLFFIMHDYPYKRSRYCLPCLSNPYISQIN